jgi:hypothetical protein
MIAQMESQTIEPSVMTALPEQAELERSMRQHYQTMVDTFQSLKEHQGIVSDAAIALAVQSVSAVRQSGQHSESRTTTDCLLPLVIGYKYAI